MRSYSRKKSQSGGGWEMLWKGRGRKTENGVRGIGQRETLWYSISGVNFFLVESENFAFFSGISELYRHSVRAGVPPRGCFFRWLGQTEFCAHPRGSTPISRDAQTVLAARWWSRFLCGNMQWMCRAWLVHISLSQIAQAKNHSQPKKMLTVDVFEGGVLGRLRAVWC